MEQLKKITEKIEKTTKIMFSSDKPVNRMCNNILDNVKFIWKRMHEILNDMSY